MAIELALCSHATLTMRKIQTAIRKSVATVAEIEESLCCARLGAVIVIDSPHVGGES